MPNIVFNPWVKIVNNLRILDRTTQGYSSPISLHKQYKYVIRIVKAYIIRQSIPQPSTAINTPDTLKTYLLSKSFTYFPQHLLINPLNEN